MPDRCRESHEITASTLYGPYFLFHDIYIYIYNYFIMIYIYILVSVKENHDSTLL